MLETVESNSKQDYFLAISDIISFRPWKAAFFFWNLKPFLCQPDELKTHMTGTHKIFYSQEFIFLRDKPKDLLTILLVTKSAPLHPLPCLLCGILPWGGGKNKPEKQKNVSMLQLDKSNRGTTRCGGGNTKTARGALGEGRVYNKQRPLQNARRADSSWSRVTAHSPSPSSRTPQPHGATRDLPRPSPGRPPKNIHYIVSYQGENRGLRCLVWSWSRGPQLNPENRINMNQQELNLNL